MKLFSKLSPGVLIWIWLVLLVTLPSINANDTLGDLPNDELPSKGKSASRLPDIDEIKETHQDQQLRAYHIGAFEDASQNKPEENAPKGALGRYLRPPPNLPSEGSGPPLDKRTRQMVPDKDGLEKTINVAKGPPEIVHVGTPGIKEHLEPVVHPAEFPAYDDQEVEVPKGDPPQGPPDAIPVAAGLDGELLHRSSKTPFEDGGDLSGPLPNEARNPKPPVGQASKKLIDPQEDAKLRQNLRSIEP